MSKPIQSVLFTSPLAISTANAGQYRILINVLNVSSTPRTGTLEILGLGGNVLSNVTYNAVAPNGGTGDELNAIANQFPISLFYGRVTVDDKPDSIRASVLITDQAGNTLVSVEAR